MNDQASSLPVRLPPGVAEALKRVLDELSRITGCRAVVVARRDGLAIIHRVGAGRDPAALAAIATATVDGAAGLARALEQGEFEQLIVRCAEGTVLAAEAGPDAVLIALYDQDADLSLSRFRLKATTRTIEAALGAAP